MFTICARIMADFPDLGMRPHLLHPHAVRLWIQMKAVRICTTRSRKPIERFPVENNLVQRWQRRINLRIEYSSVKFSAIIISSFLFAFSKPHAQINSFHEFIFHVYNHVLAPPYWQLYGSPHGDLTKDQDGMCAKAENKSPVLCSFPYGLILCVKLTRRSCFHPQCCGERAMLETNPWTVYFWQYWCQYYR